LAALVERQKTGRGTLVDAALVDSQVGVLANQALNFLVSGIVPKRQGNTHPNIVPYQVFPVADGHIIIATGNDSQYQKLCAVLASRRSPNRPNTATILAAWRIARSWWHISASSQSG